MACNSVATLPLRVPAAALAHVLSSEPAIQAIQAHITSLFKVPVETSRTAAGVVFRVGYASISLTPNGSRVVGRLPTAHVAQLEKYVQTMAMAVRQQQIAQAAAQIGKVIRDVRDPVTGARTVSVRL